MIPIADKLTAKEAEGPLSGAILHFTQVAGTDPAGVLQALTAEVRNLAGADCAFFVVPSADSSRSEPAISDGTLPAGADRMLAGLLQPSILPPADADAIEPPANGAQSWFVLPLVTPQDVLYGHLILGKAAANQFGPRYQRWTAALLAHAAVALDRAKLMAAEINAGLNLARAFAIRDNFLSVASHELRNPLNSLHLRLDILKRETALLSAPDDERERFAAHLVKAAAQVSRMAALLGRLVDIARITSGRIELRIRQYDIALQLKQIAERFAAQSPPGQIQLSTPDSVAGSWDDLRIDQVITNLLANAIKYGQGKPIKVTLAAAGDSVTITIVDHGIGIAAEDQAEIFARFERLETDQSHFGHGLSLWISQQIVTAMGGGISVRSQPGQGAVFTVRLPWRSPAS